MFICGFRVWCVLLGVDGVLGLCGFPRILAVVFATGLVCFTLLLVGLLQC